MDCSALDAAHLYERLNKDGSLWWVICGADFAGSRPVAHIQYEGGTTMDDMVSKLSDDLIQYGCFKVLGVDNKGAITSTRMKFVSSLLRWVRMAWGGVPLRWDALPLNWRVTFLFWGSHTWRRTPCSATLDPLWF